MLSSQTTLKGAPFRPFDEQYLIIGVQVARPADELASYARTARSRFGKRSRAERHALDARRRLMR